MNEATKKCVNRLAMHYRKLEAEKEDCKSHEESEIALWVAESGMRITPAHKKAIKKVAKAVATDTLDDLESDIMAECNILEDSERSMGIQLSLFSTPLSELKRTLDEEGVDFSISTRGEEHHVN